MTIWNPSIVAFSLGPIEVRWYSLCWCIGLALAYVVVYKLYKRQGIPQEKFDPLFLYCFIGWIHFVPTKWIKTCLKISARSMSR